VGVQEVRWDKDGTEPVVIHLYMKNWNVDHNLGTSFCTIHNEMRSAIKMVVFISNILWHVIVRSHWCYTVLKVHSPTENKSDDIGDSFYEEQEHVFY
jgi:hypothetical protein